MSRIILNISPPKCGTTSLYFALVGSKAIARSRIKEPRFFAQAQPDRAAGLPGAMQTGGAYGNGLAWHDDLFDENEDTSYRIDFTTYYAVTPDTPELLARTYPDPRLIFVMRDPVKRFVSHYYQYIKTGVPVPPIEDVIAGGNAVSELMYRFADYRATYARFADQFGADAILKLDFTDLNARYETISAQCNAFLGLTDVHYSPTKRDKNVAGRPRFSGLQRMMFSDAARKVTRLVGPQLKTRLLGVRKKVVLANVKPTIYPALAPELERQLSDRLAPQTEFYRAR